MVDNQAAMTALIKEELDKPTKEEREYYNCKMVEICLKEQLAKQILYVFPCILNNADHDVLCQSLTSTVLCNMTCIKLGLCRLFLKIRIK